MPDIDNINHVGMAVRDLHETVRQYEAMGFQLTPFSPHSAAWKPGEAVKPQASGNRCVMFATDYLEILASEDPARPADRISGFLARHEGAHIICFNTEDAQAVDARLRGDGIVTSGVIPLQRDIDTPEGVRTAKFERLQFAPDQSPEGYIQAARHLTPQYIYQPRYIDHPNGCTQLCETVLVTDDVGGFAEKYRRYIGRPPIAQAGGTHFRFPLGANLTIMTPERALRSLPGTLLPPLPAIAAVVLRTGQLGDQRRRLAGNGFAFAEADGRLIVPAAQASGVAVVFQA